MKIGDLGMFATHAKATGGIEVEAAGSNEILGRQPTLLQSFPIEVEFVLTFVQQVMHHL